MDLAVLHCFTRYTSGRAKKGAARRSYHVCPCVCVRVAVNDAVVMREWGLAQKVEGKVLLLADADGSFRFALG